MARCCKELWWLFCDPPCSSPLQIADKIAYAPPTPISYEITKDDNGNLKFLPDELDDWRAKRINDITVTQVKNLYGVNIIALLLRYNLIDHFDLQAEEPRKVILFSHSNATDLGTSYPVVHDMCKRLRYDIMVYEYSGFGHSGGDPTEKNMLGDIAAAYDELTNTYGYASENIILYGVSIGSVPTVDLAAKEKVHSVVLQSPISTGLRVMFRSKKSRRLFGCMQNYLNNVDKVGKILSPVLVISGTEDVTTTLDECQVLYENTTKTVPPVWIEGATHSDLMLYPDFWSELTSFLTNPQPEPSLNDQQETFGL